MKRVCDVPGEPVYCLGISDISAFRLNTIPIPYVLFEQSFYMFLLTLLKGFIIEISSTDERAKSFLPVSFKSCY